MFNSWWPFSIKFRPGTAGTTLPYSARALLRVGLGWGDHAYPRSLDALMGTFPSTEDY